MVMTVVKKIIMIKKIGKGLKPQIEVIAVRNIKKKEDISVEGEQEIHDQITDNNNTVQVADKVIIVNKDINKIIPELM